MRSHAYVFVVILLVRYVQIQTVRNHWRVISENNRQNYILLISLS